MPFPNGLPKFKELSVHQKQTLRDAGILNGCGPQSWKVHPPFKFFEADCDHHDYNYAAGFDRKKADWDFYQAMWRDVKHHSWWLRGYLYFRAWVFYQLVKHFGKPHFSKTQPASLAEMIETHGS